MPLLITLKDWLTQLCLWCMQVKHWRTCYSALDHANAPLQPHNVTSGWFIPSQRQATKQNQSQFLMLNFLSTSWRAAVTSVVKLHWAQCLGISKTVAIHIHVYFNRKILSLTGQGWAACRSVFEQDTEPHIAHQWGPAMSWRLIQGAPCPRPETRLQHPVTPWKGISGSDNDMTWHDMTWHIKSNI